jgi:hypothetical protein
MDRKNMGDGAAAHSGNPKHLLLSARPDKAHKNENETFQCHSPKWSKNIANKASCILKNDYSSNQNRKFGLHLLLGRAKCALIGSIFITMAVACMPFHKLE